MPCAVDTTPDPPDPPAAADDEVAVLGRLFAEHPAWRDAAARLAPEATSDVYFTSHPGQVWHLALRAGRARLLQGRARRPDLVFRFTPAAVHALASVQGGMDAFAVALFDRLTATDPETGVELRIAAPFSRLLRRGYVRLILASGPRVLARGRREGIGSVAGLRTLVRRHAAAERRPWELT